MQGGCLCGAVRYRLSSPPKYAVNCHCNMCKKHSGAAFLSYLVVDTVSFEITCGEVVPYRSSCEAIRGHCGICGSPLTFVFDSDVASVWLTLGSLDDPNSINPSENWHVKDKVNWFVEQDSLANWNGAPGMPDSK